MKIKNTKGTVARFKKCKALHSMIWQNDALCWLDSWNNQSPMQEYELIKRELRYIRNAKVSVFIGSLLGWSAIIMFFALLFLWLIGRDLGPYQFGFVLLSLIITSPIPSVVFNRWDQLLDGWLSASWETAEFFTDVLKLERIVCGQGYPEYKSDLEAGYGSNLDTLRRSGLEMKIGKIPKDVQQKCEEWLWSQIKWVIVQESSNPSDKTLWLPHNITEYLKRKRDIKQGFEIFKHFGILSKDARLDVYYGRETQLAL